MKIKPGDIMLSRKSGFYYEIVEIRIPKIVNMPRTIQVKSLPRGDIAEFTEDEIIKNGWVKV